MRKVFSFLITRYLNSPINIVEFLFSCLIIVILMIKEKWNLILKYKEKYYFLCRLPFFSTVSVTIWDI
jgi:IS4 transposase